jgi:hypothetical protein
MEFDSLEGLVNEAKLWLGWGGMLQQGNLVVIGMRDQATFNSLHLFKT